MQARIKQLEAEITDLHRQNAELAAALARMKHLSKEMAEFVAPLGLTDKGPNSEFSRWCQCRNGIENEADPKTILDAHDAALVNPLLCAIQAALAPLGTGKCGINICVGCEMERKEAIEILHNALPDPEKTEGGKSAEADEVRELREVHRKAEVKP